MTDTLRLGIRGHDMEAAPFEEWVANIKKKGFCCTQLALKKAIHDFNVNNEAMTPGMAMYMRQVFAENKVDVSVLGCYLNLADPNKENLKKTMDTYKANIRFAALLGCGMVGTETGAVNEEYRYEPANHSEEALEIFIENCREVVKYAESMGVILAIEPVYNHIVYDCKRARKVLDAIDSPNLQIIFDPVNIISVDNYKNQDEILEEAFDLLRNEIIAIHSKDFVIEDNKVISKITGQGILNYDLLMSLVKKYKPLVHVLLEGTSPENVESAKEYVIRKYREA
ncbi:MAG: sugar phosphate isomerase/epimerase [Lachnospiraceae bacterium]|nr:sugar phosphate isomerase/epimerase [Lachnospiraceae bacterium]